MIVNCSTNRDSVTMITVNDEQVTKLAFERCLSFLYTGCADVKDGGDLDDTIAAAKLLELSGLIVVCNKVRNSEKPDDTNVKKEFNKLKSEIMRKAFFNKTLYSDITFIVDGQRIPAHRCVLVSRCEVMSAMFSGRFTESKTTEVRCDSENLYI